MHRIAQFMFRCGLLVAAICSAVWASAQTAESHLAIQEEALVDAPSFVWQQGRERSGQGGALVPVSNEAVPQAGETQLQTGEPIPPQTGEPIRPRITETVTVWSGPIDVDDTSLLPGETEEDRRARIYTQAERELEIQVQQRMLVVVPAFNNVMSGRAMPLSKGQKTRLAIRATVDPYNVVGAFVFGGLSELQGTHRGYGWGAQGYFKRVGANAADVAAGTMLAGAAYPILLRQDPRYFRKGTGSVKSRVAHALLGAFICRGDNRKTQPNFSNVLGNLSAGLLSNVYYPADDRGIWLAVVNSSIVTLEGSLGNLALEFDTDVERWWHNRKQPKPTP